MRRREFISVLGGAAATWSFAVRAQQPERIRRVSILLPATADDAEFQTWIAAFHQAMALLGWNIGRNLRVDTRWATSNAADIRRHASELAASAPDVILAHGAATLAPLLQVTRTVPTVFVVVTDPVGAGLVESLPRPNGNATGFMNFEYGIGAKWGWGGNFPRVGDFDMCPFSIAADSKMFCSRPAEPEKTLLRRFRAGGFALFVQSVA